MVIGGYQILNLDGIAFEVDTPVTIKEAITNKPILVSGLALAKLTLKDFWFNGSTNDGIVYTHDAILTVDDLQYNLSINVTSGAVTVTTTEIVTQEP